MTTQVEVNVTQWPLDLTINKLGVGGVTGLTPTVALRNAATVNSYLDWSDYVFKTSGWIQQYLTLTEVGHGYYRALLNVALLNMPVGTVLSAEYANTGSGVAGNTAETLEIVQVQEEVNFLRKIASNRLEEVSGSPGMLTLYDDDGVTPLTNWQLQDERGGPVVYQPGAPAKRSASS
jgi:hypothetical protein